MSSTSDDDWLDRAPLHRASQSGRIDEVRRLVEQGSDVNAIDSFGTTPLHEAAKREHFEIMTILLKHGANVDAFDDLGMTPLHYAAKQEVVTFLFKHGANVNAIHEPTIGRPPLAFIAPTCSLRMAQMLLERGANPTLQIGLCRTALDAAKERKRGDGPLVYALLMDAVKRRRNPSR
jgi:ankyrin repeat protein